MEIKETGHHVSVVIVLAAMLPHVTDKPERPSAESQLILQICSLVAI